MAEALNTDVIDRDPDVSLNLTPQATQEAEGSKTKTSKMADPLNFVTKSQFKELNDSVKDLTSTVSSLIKDIVPIVKSFQNTDSQLKASDTDQRRLSRQPSPSPQPGPSSALSRSPSPNPLPEEDGLSYFQQVAGVVEETGPDINSVLAQGVTKILETGLSDQEVEKLDVKYNTTPNNCQELKVLKCNDEIFKSVKRATRMHDLALQRVQKNIKKGIIALTKAYESASDLETKKSILDSMSLCANGSHQLNVVRRNSFKPEINKEYSGLCAESRPIKESLFGSLSEEAKNQAETSKITHQIKKFSSNKPFLGQRGLQRKYTQGRPYNSYKNYNSYNKHYNTNKMNYKKKDNKKEGRR